MSQNLDDRVRWTTTDIDLLPENERIRYEIIDGELFATRSPHIRHQGTCGNILLELQTWSRATGTGEAFFSPGIVFTEADNVIPDVIWISNERLAVLVDDEGHLTGAPELVVEVLSAGTEHERRDREAKLKLYSSKGVQEYWIVNWRLQQVEVYRRENAQLRLMVTLLNSEQLTSPLLPGFTCSIACFFA